MMVL
jgi:hypothetical protein